MSSADPGARAPSLVRQFSYRALDPAAGTVVKGSIEAASEAAVAAKLRAQGLTPLSVTTVVTSGWFREITLPSLGGHVTVGALAVLASQLSSLIDAGLPLLRALAVLGPQTANRRLQAALSAVAADVEAGASFSAALAREPAVFPPLLVSMVRVGEAGGFLPESLRAIARTYARESELIARVRAAVTYPLVVLVIAVLGIVAMVAFVVPVFEGMFQSIGSELPIPTQILVALSRSSVWTVPLGILAAVGGWAWWIANRRRPGIRRIVDPIRLRMPVVGPLVTKIAVARFARNLAMMLRSGVPLIQALSVVGETSGNVVVERAVRDIQESVREGRSFAAPLARAEVFPPMVAHMVAVGEESGTLDEMLASVADLYEREVETATGQLTSIVEPLLIVVIGLLIGGMVVSLYLPIFTLYGDLTPS